MSKVFILYIFPILSLLILAQTPIYSQTTDSSHGPVELGVAFGAIGPVGNFRDNVGGWSIHDKGGFDFDLIMDISRSGFFRLRFDYFFGQYERDKEADYSYWFRAFSLGPEVGPSNGPAFPYVNAGYEWLSSFEGSYTPDTVKQQIRESAHGGSGWFFGGGVRLPLGSPKRWAIDIGSRYHLGGKATYLKKGSIQANPDETFTVIPSQGQMRFMIFTLGIQWRPRTSK